MNIVLYDDEDLQNAEDASQIILRDRRATHIKEILRLAPGASIRIGKINSLVGTAAVTDVSDTFVKLSISSLDRQPPPVSRVELILALPRPKSLKRTLRAVANLGIKSVHLIHSIRVDKSYWKAPVLDPAVLRETLLDGLSIAGDTVLPKIQLHRFFKPFVQDVAPHLVTDTAFVAHPADDSAHLYTAASRGGHAGIPVAIGPEGGFSSYEVGLFNEAGFKTLSLGPRIYSVECAVPVIESALRSR